MPHEILPDSRLKSAKEHVMVDWKITDEFGNPKTIKLELEPIFCFNCGKPNGYVPTEILSWCSWLCLPCAEKWGPKATELHSSDDRFWEDVAAEMMSRFGKVLTQHELEVLASQGRLGSALEKLERESPYLL